MTAKSTNGADSHPTPPRRRTSLPVTVLKKLEDKIGQKQVHVYTDLSETPVITVRVPGYSSGRFSIESAQFGNWLSDFAWTETGRLLAGQGLNRIRRVLQGRALSIRRLRPGNNEVLAALKNNPVIALVVEYVHEKIASGNSVEYSLSTFFKNVRDFGADQGNIGRHRLPAGANVFSRILNKNRRLLRELGIEFEIRRSNGAIITIKRLDDCDGKPSAESSACKSSSGSNLTTTDAEQAHVEFARDLIRRNNQGERT